MGTTGEVRSWVLCFPAAGEFGIDRGGGGGGIPGYTVKLGLEKFCFVAGGVGGGGGTGGAWCDLFPSIGEEGVVAPSTSAEEVRECTFSWPGAPLVPSSLICITTVSVYAGFVSRSAIVIPADRLGFLLWGLGADIRGTCGGNRPKCVLLDIVLDRDRFVRVA